MGLTITKLKEQEIKGETHIHAKDRLCLTEDGRLVLEGDPAGRWLYAIPGQLISIADARRYGLIEPEAPKPETEPAPDETEPKPETKESSPAETKVSHPQKTKRHK